MKRLVVLFLAVIFFWLSSNALQVFAGSSAYDDARAIEEASRDAEKLADEGKLEEAREKAKEGWDTPAPKPTNPSEYNIPMPKGYKIDKEHSR